MDAMKTLVLLALAGCSAGCSIDMSPSQPWVPIDGIGAPLVPELEATPPPPGFHSKRPAVTTAPLRVVTYNVQYGPDVPGVVAALTDDPQLAKAGLILIQEVESYPGEGASRAAQIANGLGFGYVYVPARVRDAGTHGLAILSAFPITNVEKMDLPDCSDSLRHRIAISADIDVDGHLLHVIDVHLDTKLNAGERIGQLSPVVRDAPPATLIGGDFNTSWVAWVKGVPILDTTGASDQAPVIDSYMTHLGFDAPTRDSGVTEHMYGIEQRLDSIYTRELDVTFGGVVHVGPSDHWPMWLDVQVP
jgi:endonuclease/exonuclease/phosphatase family metal-dependent hydrolase